jgi:hypothetical protein
MPKHEFMTDEQYARFLELLNKFNARKRLTIAEDDELEYLLDLDMKTYETPEYLAFAAKMDAHLEAVYAYQDEVK